MTLAKRLLERGEPQNSPEPDRPGTGSYKTSQRNNCIVVIVPHHIELNPLFNPNQKNFASTHKLFMENSL